MTEDDKSFSANAKGTDVDFGSRLTYGIAGGHIGDADSADINDLKAAFDGDKGMGNAHTRIETEHGVFTIDSATGKYTYTPNENLSTARSTRMNSPSSCATKRARGHSSTSPST